MHRSSKAVLLSCILLLLVCGGPIVVMSRAQESQTVASGSPCPAKSETRSKAKSGNSPQKCDKLIQPEYPCSSIAVTVSPTAATVTPSVQVARSQLATAQAQEHEAQAALQQAQINLDHTRIMAPVDGTVIARRMDVGQTVASTLNPPTIFEIAQDLTKMQVDTNADESDVGNVAKRSKGDIHR